MNLCSNLVHSYFIPSDFMLSHLIEQDVIMHLEKNCIAATQSRRTSQIEVGCSRKKCLICIRLFIEKEGICTYNLCFHD